MLRQQMEMDMAKTALREAASMEALDKKLDAEVGMFEDALDQKKKAAILSMLAAEETAPKGIDPLNFLRNQQITDSALLTGVLQERQAKNTTAGQLSSGLQGFSGLDFSGILEDWAPILSPSKSAKDYLKQADEDKK